MKLRSLALTLVLAFTVGCAGSSLAPKAPANLTPQVTAAFYATYAIKDLAVVRDFVGDAAQAKVGLISKETALKVINWHEALITAIHASPGGWKVTVNAALTQLPNLIPAADYAKVKPFLSAVTTFISEVQ